VTAVFSIWLAARAEGIGMGWVSILDPVIIGTILDVPRDWRFIGYFCRRPKMPARNWSVSAGNNVDR